MWGGGVKKMLTPTYGYLPPPPVIIEWSLIAISTSEDDT